MARLTVSVSFIAWYYYAAPRHSIFAIVRRTVTLCNFMAFAIFTAYPTMPPRLLPKEYGFIDTVRRDDAESVWMSGKFVNHLAAMPSMHFGYAFMIGITCWYHAGAFRWAGYGYENRSWLATKAGLCVIGFMYPFTILVTIIATANHVSYTSLRLCTPMPRDNRVLTVSEIVLSRCSRECVRCRSCIAV